MEKDTFKEDEDKISNLEKELEETKKDGEKLNYSNDELDKLDREISSVEEKLNALLETKKRIKDYLSKKRDLESRIKYAKQKLQKRREDYSEEEFCEQLKKVWESYFDAETDDIDKQIYNKTALLLIEYNILICFYDEKLEKARRIFARENDVSYKETVVPIPESEKSKFSFLRKKEQTRIKRERISEKEDEGRDLYSDLIFARILEIREIINCIWGVNQACPLAYNKGTYRELIDDLKESPQAIGECHGGLMLVNHKELFKHETAQKLYEELLIPYYIKMGFPVKEENGKKIPYAFVLGIFNGDNNQIERDYLIEKKAKEFYIGKGVDEVLLSRFTGATFYISWGDLAGYNAWISESMFLSPSEITLLGKYNFLEKYKSKLIDHIEQRHYTFENEIRNYDSNQEESHTR